MRPKDSIYRRATAAVFIIVLAVLMSPPIAQAQRAEYEELTKALEAARDLREEIDVREKQLAAYRRAGDPFTTGARRATLELLRQIGELEAQVASRQGEYQAAVDKFRQAMTPYIRIQEKAVATIDYLRKETSGNMVVKKRAIHGIALDVARMNWGLPNSPSSRVATWYLAAREALLNGTLTGPVEQNLNDQLKDDPALQAAVNRAWNYATDFIRDNKGSLLPQDDLKRLLGPSNAAMIKDRLAGLDRLYGYVEWGQRGTRLLALLTSDQSDPLAPPALAELSEFIDLVGDVADEFKGPPQLLTIYLIGIKWQVDAIIEQVKHLEMQLALNNLEAMKAAATARTDEDGDTWAGLTGGAPALFGVPGPNPKIYPACAQFTEGEAVSGKWFGSLRYDKSAWMGIMPSSVRHGDETLAGDKTIDYVWLDGKDQGQFSFVEKLSPGSYDLRMFDSNSNGREVQSVAIRVTARVAGAAPARPCNTDREVSGNLSGSWMWRSETESRDGFRIEEVNGKVTMSWWNYNPDLFVGTRRGDIVAGTAYARNRPRECSSSTALPVRAAAQLRVVAGSDRLELWMKQGEWRNCTYHEYGDFLYAGPTYVRRPEMFFD